MARNQVREHIGWLIWCMAQGYVKAEDRASLTNWLLEDEATLTEDDRATKLALLVMADEILREIDESAQQ